MRFIALFTACAIKNNLGMANHKIRDNQITASSVFRNDVTGFRASLARLNLTKVTNLHVGAWAQIEGGQNPWLQVDFLVKRIICAVLTQGRQDEYQFVKTYTIRESSDGWHFVEYKDRGMTKVPENTFLILSSKKKLDKGTCSASIDRIFVAFL